MERNRKQKLLIVLALIVAIVSLTIGFAAFSTTLNISSSVSVTPSTDNFEIRFSTSPTITIVSPVVASYKTAGVTATDGTIINNATPTITNISATFTEPEQSVSYTVYVRNDGEYTAYLNSVRFHGEKKCITLDDTTNSLVQNTCENIYFTINIRGNSFRYNTEINSYPLAPGESEMVYINLDYFSTETLADGPFSIIFPSISMEYSTSDAVSMQPSTQSKICTYVDSEDDTGYQIGKIDLSDVVTCGTESFYVMSNENGKVTMLSMYNLYVGNSVDEEWNPTPLKSPTGIQNIDARGYVVGKYPFIGTTAFSDIDSTYSGSIVEGYVNNYKIYLTNMGLDISSARLATKLELEKLGCSSSTYSCISAPSWVYSTSYWSESANGVNVVWLVSSEASFGNGNYRSDIDIGVRPVIEISESEILN